MVAAVAEAGGGPVRFDKPKYAVERTRNQVLCRTGYRGPGQSIQLKFGEGAKFANEAQAIAAAKKWLVEERRRQGL